ncbi:MAG: hypothetical protein BWY94_01235 [Actinobacteria bacterium ADurb.BinA094]|nr:MAG: hypothetical protein BWY94_01235 [Actinobacteria bacterium ADurb.BinA094]
MRRLVMLGTMILAASIMLIACGSTADEAATDATPDAAGSSPAAPLPDETAPEEPTASSSIILPDGWTMTDALSADEVGAITGKKMVVFPEGSSAAQNGKPAGGYLVTDIKDSKVFFGVDVQGGEAGYDSQVSYGEPGSVKEVGGVGDKASVLTFSDGRAGIIVLKEDAVIRIDWNPKVFKDDPADFGSKLANLLLKKMFG